MKKIISTILACMILVGSVLTLSSCGKMIVGKYEANLIVAEVTYEFGILGSVTCTIDPVIGDESVYEGTYELNDEGDKLTITFENDDAGEYEGEYIFASGEENGKKYIRIGILTYDKVD